MQRVVEVKSLGVCAFGSGNGRIGVAGRSVGSFRFAAKFVRMVGRAVFQGFIALLLKITGTHYFRDLFG